MKNILITMSLICISSIAIAQNKIVKTSFKVYGNCTQCKERIETALDTKGVKFADWNIETKMLQLVYDSTKISEEQIKQKIANVGHDTEKVKAPNNVYLKLPDCCLFRENDNTHHD